MSLRKIASWTYRCSVTNKNTSSVCYRKKKIEYLHQELSSFPFSPPSNWTTPLPVSILYVRMWSDVLALHILYTYNLFVRDYNFEGFFFLLSLFLIKNILSHGPKNTNESKFFLLVISYPSKQQVAFSRQFTRSGKGLAKGGHARHKH